MLKSLRIKNFGLIQAQTLDFFEGLNLLTGETGGGKSMIIAALALLCGDRVYSHQIRSGESSGMVEGRFEVDSDLARYAGVGEKQLVLSRTFNLGGQSKSYVNGKIVPLKRLKEIGNRMNDIHGQHDQQALLDPAVHLSLLDAFVGLDSERKALAETYGKILELEGQLKALSLSEAELQLKKEMLAYQIEEIQTAALTDPAEKETLARERDLLANGEKIQSLCQETRELLYEGQDALYDRLNRLLQNLESLRPFDPDFDRFLKTIQEWPYQIEEIAGFARIFGEKIDYDPARLSQVEERLATIEKLERKYSKDLRELQVFLSQLKKELNLITGNQDREEELRESVSLEYKRFSEMAHKISEARKKAAERLERSLEGELKHLAMGKSKIKIQFSTESRDDSRIKNQGEGVLFSNTGFDIVEFFLSSNPGENFKPLSRIASGGELSRIMLALRSIGAKAGEVSTLIFDEVDAGIGGKEAAFIGLKLRELASAYQVICITHLPQIAAYADCHLFAEKSEKAGRTFTRVKRLVGADSVREVARMLAGKEITKSSLAHAEDLIAKSRGDQT